MRPLMGLGKNTGDTIKKIKIFVIDLIRSLPRPLLLKGGKGDMSIDEAIKRLEDFNDHGVSYNSGSFARAVQLGIEALKHIRTRRLVHPIYEVDKLPGETKP